MAQTEVQESGPEAGAPRPSQPLITLAVAVLLSMGVAALGIAYYAYFSKAATVARDLPVGATARDVAARLGPWVYDRRDDGHVLTCTYRFKDGSVLGCAFATRVEAEHHTETEIRTGITGTTLKRYQSGTIPGPYWDMPTYDYMNVPDYGPVLVEVDKTRTVTRWVLGSAHVLPRLSFGKHGTAILLPDGPTSVSIPPVGVYSPPSAAPPTEPSAPEGASGETAVEYWRGHAPQKGTAERKSLMDAARARLHTKSQFIVRAIVVAGDSAVADLTPEHGGARRVVTFSKRAGKWTAVSDQPGSDATFETITGVSADSELTGEL